MMKRRILVGGFILLSTLGIFAQSGGDFESAQWIGAMTRQQAHIPQGRNFTGAKLKEPAVKAAWATVDTLSQKSIYLKRDLRIRDRLKRATLYICGLGFYELTINGEKVGDAVFAPLWSDYDKSIFYNVYDVTQQLKQPLKGRMPHELKVLLGNGFYNEQGKRYAKMKISFGPPTLLFRLHLEYTHGKTEDIVSDDSWKYAYSETTFNSIYGGEDYDARIKVKDWKTAVVQEAPKGTLRRQIAEPVKIMERYDVQRRIAVTNTPDGQSAPLVLDMGQNLSGFPEITVKGKAGQCVRLTVGETLTPEGLVNQKQTGRPHYYTYTLRGEQYRKRRAMVSKTEQWHPRFSYYGFRYIQVDGAVMEGDANPQQLPVITKIQSCFVYNSARKTATFECSNPLFNDAYRLIDRAIRSNWQAVWTDCPHREKLGWLEQDWLNGEGLVANYDCRSMMEQTLQNIADAQFPNGALPEIAPNLCVFEGSWAPPFLESPEWGGAFIALPFLYQTFYGDDRIIRQYRPQMKRYVDYLATQDSCYILRQGLGDWYDYGPGRAGFAQNTPMPLVSTAHYYWWNHLMGEPRADSIKAAFIKEFYHPDTHRFASGSQCAQAIALEMDLVPAGDREEVLQQLIEDIHAHGDRLTTGDVGNRYLFNALIHNGQQELLYQMLNHDEVPGYGYQIKLGHTTLTEQWNPEHGASMNHFMMGHLNNLLVPYFLGLWRQGNQMTIAPHPVGDLSWCRGSMETPQGTVRCEWRIQQQTFHLTIHVPEHLSTDIIMPYSGETKHVTAGDHTYQETINPHQQ